MKRLLLTTLALVYGCSNTTPFQRENCDIEYQNRPAAINPEYKKPAETIEEYLKRVPKLPLPVDKEFEEKLFKKKPEQKRQILPPKNINLSRIVFV